MANTTQRSWDNYEGDTPNRFWVGSDLYGNSSRYRPGGSDLERFGGGNRTQRSWDNYVGKSKDSKKRKPLTDIIEEEDEESQWDKLQTNPLSKRMKEKQRQSALERGMSEIQKGRTVDDNFDEDFYVS